MKVNLTENQKQEIKQFHRNCKQKRYADRCKAILLLDKGFSCVEVGQKLLRKHSCRAYKWHLKRQILFRPDL